MQLQACTSHLPNMCHPIIPRVLSPISKNITLVLCSPFLHAISISAIIYKLILSSPSSLSMADFRQQQQQLRPGGQGTAGIFLPGKGASTSQVLAVVTLLPAGGTLLFLAGLTLGGTLIGLAVATPLFVIFSPALVPAALVIGLGVPGFLTSGAFGVTALSSLSWMASYIRSLIRGPLPQKLDQAKRRTRETAGQVGQKARETGQIVQSKAREVTKGGQEGGKT